MPQVRHNEGTHDVKMPTDEEKKQSLQIVATAVGLSEERVLNLARGWKAVGKTDAEVRRLFSQLAEARGNPLAWSGVPGMALPPGPPAGKANGVT